MSKAIKLEMKLVVDLTRVSEGPEGLHVPFGTALETWATTLLVYKTSHVLRVDENAIPSSAA